MKLTGPQRLVLNRIASGDTSYGKHNDTCSALRKLGLVRMEMHPSSFPGCPDQPHWFLTEAGRIEFCHSSREDDKQ